MRSPLPRGPPLWMVTALSLSPMVPAVGVLFLSVPLSQANQPVGPAEVPAGTWQHIADTSAAAYHGTRQTPSIQSIRIDTGAPDTVHAMELYNPGSMLLSCSEYQRARDKRSLWHHTKNNEERTRELSCKLTCPAFSACPEGENVVCSGAVVETQTVLIPTAAAGPPRACEQLVCHPLGALRQALHAHNTPPTTHTHTHTHTSWLEIAEARSESNPSCVCVCVCVC
jgi:hypothetical protein